jgi:hypothetical protein
MQKRRQRINDQVRVQIEELEGRWRAVSGRTLLLSILCVVAQAATTKSEAGVGVVVWWLHYALSSSDGSIHKHT